MCYRGDITVGFEEADMEEQTEQTPACTASESAVETEPATPAASVPADD